MTCMCADQRECVYIEHIVGYICLDGVSTDDMNGIMYLISIGCI
jgi:hypothetical protein